MNEKWNEFVYELIDALRRNVEEDEYHLLIENQLKGLGWVKYKGEICHKPNVPIGNSKYIQPDILIKCNDEDLFVIEVKRPVHTLIERERQQLESYMRQLKLKVGVYIGEHIEVFYDHPDSRDAVSVLTVPLEMDNKRGARFVDLFAKENFSKAAITDFCENRIKEMHRQESLNKIKDDLVADAQVHIVESLKPYLIEKYGSTFSEADIENMLSSLAFSAVPKDIASTGVAKTVINPPQTNGKTEKKSAKRIYDNTNYSLNGGPSLLKNRFVYAVVSTYLKEHPTATFNALEQIFRPEMQGSFGVIRTMEYIQAKNYDGRRYFKEKEFVLMSGDGIPFAVSTEWSKNNLPAIIELAKSLGYSVTSSSEKAATVISPENKKDAGSPQANIIKCFLTRNANAQGLFNIDTESLIVLKGSKVNPHDLPKAADYIKEMRQMHIAESAVELHGEVIVTKDIDFDSPSGAAQFCVGGSANGWIEWKDEKNNQLKIYKKPSAPSVK